MSKIRNHQKGQVLLIFGLFFVLLLGIVGLATDSAFAYFRSIQMERAAAAAALAGVPYMPLQFDTPAGSSNASARAILEAKRNGFDPASPGVTVVPSKTGIDRELAVTITAPSPTFFLAALQIRPITISRTAVAGYKPPIALGQPGARSGSTVATLGNGSDFYYAIYKGWNNQRSEGDPFTPNPNEQVTNSDAGAKTSADVHTISTQNGLESPQLDCKSASPYKMPCRGGYNWTITVPPLQTAEIDIYNAAYAPDFGKFRNNCDNQKNLPAGSCNPNGANYRYHEDDNGTKCNPNCSVADAKNYTATVYTLLSVPDLFLRSQDTVLTQTTVYPIDATNYDGNQGNTGTGSTQVPTYHNVKDNNDVTQYYDATGNPCNMKIYHAWADIANYDGNSTCGAAADNVGTNTLVSRVTTCGTPCSSGGAVGALGEGTYRLRIDALTYDGSWNTSTTQPFDAKASKGYAVRAFDPISNAECARCRVSAAGDMAIYTPINGSVGVVPLFELSKDYAGATIDVDVFDIGDSKGMVNLAILNPSGAVASSLPIANLSVTNLGISRLFPGTPHVGPQPPAPNAIGPANRGSFSPDRAGYEAANTTLPYKGPEYQGSWIRISIPISPLYAAVAPNDFWSLQYTNTAGANDTFAFTVTARGGPVHLLRS